MGLGAEGIESPPGALAVVVVGLVTMLLTGEDVVVIARVGELGGSNRAAGRR